MDPDTRLALSYLESLSEETMRRAWGEASEERRRRISVAAVIFGRRFEELMERDAARESDFRRLLMRLMNDAIRGLSKVEDMSHDEATSFLSDVGVRDRILELNEVMETHESGDTGKTLDELLSEAVDKRKDRAIWSDHWSSG